MRISQEQYDGMKARKKNPGTGRKNILRSGIKSRPRPKHTPGKMNKLETLFLQSYIQPKVYSGDFLCVDFESIKLRLAKTTFYTPDFTVATPDEFIFFEVKGFWEDDARVKIKVAADKYPHFRFIAVQKKTTKEGSGWKFENFEPA